LEKVTIALDAMGGDHGEKSVVPAALAALKANPELNVILTGDESAIRKQMALASSPERLSVLEKRIRIVHTDESVGMDELPSYALRNKKRSSMRLAIELVKSGEAHACVSAGNTGALMITAKFVLKTLPGIDRPAIMSEMPGINGITRVLDLGANVDSCAEHLFQFAVMGSVLATALDNIERPKVGLMNIGVEEIKGNDQVKRTAHLLANAPELNYIGYVEGDEMFKGTVDVVVCDGFVGNVALKSAEGISKLLVHFLKETYVKNLFTRLIALITYPILKKLKKKFDPARYNGASLLGLNGTVVKSHGSATVTGFQYAIQKAFNEAKKEVPNHIREKVALLLNEGTLL
jgi:glycerol-3-phosphate acyltransferase PlsX